MSSILDFTPSPQNTWDELNSLLNPVQTIGPSPRSMPPSSGTFMLPGKGARSWNNTESLPWCSFDNAAPGLQSLPVSQSLPTPPSSGGFDATFSSRTPSGGIFVGHSSIPVPLYSLTNQANPLSMSAYGAASFMGASSAGHNFAPTAMNEQTQFSFDDLFFSPTSTQSAPPNVTQGHWHGLHELPSYLNLPTSCSFGDPSQMKGFHFHPPTPASSNSSNVHLPFYPSEISSDKPSLPEQPRLRRKYTPRRARQSTGSSTDSSDSSEDKPFRTGECRWVEDGAVCGAHLDDASGSVSMHIYQHSGMKVSLVTRNTPAGPVVRNMVKCRWEGCKAPYMLPTSLSRHVKTHLKFLDEKCDECGMVFTRKSSMSRHNCVGMTYRTTKHSPAWDKRAEPPQD